jgi:transcriptional regulator with XRE-family HTH domain
MFGEVNTKMSAREYEIADRLRRFRVSRGISRTAFALAIGIGSERLASYESGRAPLRYEVFSAINKRFLLNPYWLATGITGPTDFDGPFDDSRWSINGKDRFIKVFDSVLEGPLSDGSYDLHARGAGLSKRMAALVDLLYSKDRWASIDVEVILALAAYVEVFLERVREVSRRALGNPALLADFKSGGLKPVIAEKKELTLDSEYRNVDSMKSPMQILLNRVSLATKARGQKAALAKFLKVPPPRVSDWLRGNYEPSGDVTLRLLEWVRAEEVKQQKSPDDVTSTAKGKTRSTHQTYEGKTRRKSPGKP